MAHSFPGMASSLYTYTHGSEVQWHNLAGELSTAKAHHAVGEVTSHP